MIKMRQPIYKKKFAKDFKRVLKRGHDMTKLETVINDLVLGKSLDKKYLDHALKGEYTDCREYHIEPDWLLIYLIDKEDILFVRTGTHADLFR